MKPHGVKRVPKLQFDKIKRLGGTDTTCPGTINIKSKTLRQLCTSRQCLRHCQEPGSIFLKRRPLFKKISTLPPRRLPDSAAFARFYGPADVGKLNVPIQPPPTLRHCTGQTAWLLTNIRTLTKIASIKKLKGPRTNRALMDIPHPALR